MKKLIVMFFVLFTLPLCEKEEVMNVLEDTKDLKQESSTESPDVAEIKDVSNDSKDQVSDLKVDDGEAKSSDTTELKDSLADAEILNDFKESFEEIFDSKEAESDVCVPNCENKECGSDGCGGSCGVCPEGKLCEISKCISVGDKKPELVCCEKDNKFYLISDVECLKKEGKGVEFYNCDRKCCKLNGKLAMTTEDQCIELGGEAKSLIYCTDYDNSCCRIGENYSFKPMSECFLEGGIIVSGMNCLDYGNTICCIYYDDLAPLTTCDSYATSSYCEETYLMYGPELTKMTAGPTCANVCALFPKNKVGVNSKACFDFFAEEAKKYSISYDPVYTDVIDKCIFKVCCMFPNNIAKEKTIAYCEDFNTGGKVVMPFYCENFKSCDNNRKECELSSLCYGFCKDGEVCSDTGVCCKPDCENKECGDDGCGGSCGECETNFICVNGTCEESPNCGDGKCGYGETPENCPSDCPGNCCTYHDTPGCENKIFEDFVCKKRPSCCSERWDGFCVDIINNFSEELPSTCCQKECSLDKCGYNSCGKPCFSNFNCVFNDCSFQGQCVKIGFKNYTCGNKICEEWEEYGCPQDCSNPCCYIASPPQQDCEDEDIKSCVSQYKPLCSSDWTYSCAYNAIFSKCGDACCIPHCEGVECGDDGCGGSCGECAGNAVCFHGKCCSPNCTNTECGDDGCGGSCGTCDNGFACVEGKCKKYEKKFKIEHPSIVGAGQIYTPEVIPLSNGTFFIKGFEFPENKITLFKHTVDTGELIYEKSFYGNKYTTFIPTQDEKYLIGFGIKHFPESDSDKYFLMKIKVDTGEIVWERLYDCFLCPKKSGSFTRPMGVLPDGSIYIVSPDNEAFYFLKFNKEGYKVSQRLLTPPGKNSLPFYKTFILNDHIIFLGGYSNTTFLLKTDFSGKVVTYNYFSLMEYVYTERCGTINNFNDNGFLINCVVKVHNAEASFLFTFDENLNITNQFYYLLSNPALDSLLYETATLFNSMEKIDNEKLYIGVVGSCEGGIVKNTLYYFNEFGKPFDQPKIIDEKGATFYFIKKLSDGNYLIWGAKVENGKELDNIAIFEKIDKNGNLIYLFQ